MNRGIAYARQGDFDAAIADFDKAIELDTNNAKAYLLRGRAYFEIGERETAISDLERALELGLEPSLKQDAEALLEELGR